jgi:hypothetical protein
MARGASDGFVTDFGRAHSVLPGPPTASRAKSFGDGRTMFR